MSITVAELIEVLSKYPPDIKVIVPMFSDYAELDKDDVRLMQAVDKDFYIMRAYRQMEGTDKEKEQTYLLISAM